MPDLQPCLCSTGRRAASLDHALAFVFTHHWRVSYNKRARLGCEEERALSRVNGARHLTLSAPISAQRCAALTRARRMRGGRLVTWATGAVRSLTFFISCFQTQTFYSRWQLKFYGKMHSWTYMLTSVTQWQIQTYNLNPNHKPIPLKFHLFLC